MTASKPSPEAKLPLLLPEGVTQAMLARAMFLESVQDQKLTPVARQQRWKDEGKLHLRRAARIVKQLSRLSTKNPA